MTKKQYTSPVLKQFELESAAPIAASAGLKIQEGEYTGTFTSDTHAWDSSNWSGTDEEDED